MRRHLTDSRIEGAASAALLTPLIMHVIELLAEERERNVALRVLAVHRGVPFSSINNQ